MAIKFCSSHVIILCPIYVPSFSMYNLLYSTILTTEFAMALVPSHECKEPVGNLRIQSHFILKSDADTIHSYLSVASRTDCAQSQICNAISRIEGKVGYVNANNLARDKLYEE